MSLADLARQHPMAKVISRRLSEYAWTGDVAAANVEPVASYMPLWDFCHLFLPHFISGPDVLWSLSRLADGDLLAGYAPPAALTSISTPQAAKQTPAPRPSQWPVGS